ncbi:winged helix-turn-helix domain-containing protein [Curtobacterium sp. USHLN213]|uniref:winged helix-turn-helix domain-containing protein n=1 Tax=Curtobacterium sp. USHLN213 TaxID=3081255 RepID=UPI0030178E40
MTRTENRLERLRGALRYMDQHGASRRLDVWEHVRALVPLEGEERELNGSGDTQGQSDFLWGTTALVHAGFMEKPRPGEWVVTDEGRAIARPELSLEAFGAALNERERAFQQAQREDLALRLRTEIVPPDWRADVIRTKERLFVERGLRALDSVFAPGRSGLLSSQLTREFRPRVRPPSNLPPLRVRR